MSELLRLKQSVVFFNIFMIGYIILPTFILLNIFTEVYKQSTHL